jgi:hypothetical protein
MYKFMVGSIADSSNSGGLILDIYLQYQTYGPRQAPAWNLRAPATRTVRRRSAAAAAAAAAMLGHLRRSLRALHRLPASGRPVPLHR